MRVFAAVVFGTLAAACATGPQRVATSAAPSSSIQSRTTLQASPARATRQSRKAVAQLQHDLAAVFDAAVMAHAQWGVVVRSLDSGETLYELNGSKLMMPASNMKIVTLAGAAHTIGWNTRFTTTLETAGTVEAGVLRGDLFVRGGGDPTINTRNARGAAVFSEWVAALKAAGIAEISGRIIGDDGYFDDEGIGAGWAWDYLQYGYAAPVGALQYNEDIADLTVTPGSAAGDPAVVQLSPGSGYTLINRATTSAAGIPETIDYRRQLDRATLEVFGTVPQSTAAPAGTVAPLRTAARQVAVLNPTVYLVESLRNALVAAGIRVTGEAMDMDDLAEADRAALAVAASRRVVVKSESPTLREIAVVLMKVSQNLYAETLLKAAGVSSGKPGSVPAGREAVLSALHAWQLDDRSLVMSDGSGLSRYNYVSARLLADILAHMWGDPAHRGPFSASLPVAGKDGTTATRMRRSRAEGNAMAKTGSISNVRSLSGYVRTRDGEMLTFSILANDFVIPAAAVNWMQDLAVEVLANFTRTSSLRSKQ
jgi:serine-type D-Ala-D-Ala carboxypeptidase/endopeptidase (penicillin-binding protein 4)